MTFLEIVAGVAVGIAASIGGIYFGVLLSDAIRYQIAKRRVLNQPEERQLPYVDPMTVWPTLPPHNGHVSHQDFEGVAE